LCTPTIGKRQQAADNLLLKQRRSRHAQGNGQVLVPDDALKIDAGLRAMTSMKSHAAETYSARNTTLSGAALSDERFATNTVLLPQLN